jgi:outer membrane receptor protein involved in Fe transport
LRRFEASPGAQRAFGRDSRRRAAHQSQLTGTVRHQSIEVLKGPQGAVYGRNAIGGAILLTTKEPGDTHEHRFRLGYDDGPGTKAQFMSGGPLGDSDTLKYQASLSYYDTDGWIDNPYLGEEADPFKDTSVRLRLIGDPSDRLRWDARVYDSEVETQALYFNIVADANDTSLPVRVNNRGINTATLAGFVQGGLRPRLGDVHLDRRSTRSRSSVAQRRLLTDHGSLATTPRASMHKAVPRRRLRARNSVSRRAPTTASLDRRRLHATTDRFISTGNVVDNGLNCLHETPRGGPFDVGSLGHRSHLVDSQDNFA